MRDLCGSDPEDLVSLKISFRKVYLHVVECEKDTNALCVFTSILSMLKQQAFFPLNQSFSSLWSAFMLMLSSHAH